MSEVSSRGPNRVFPLFKHQNMLMGEFHVVQKRRTTLLVTQKLRNVRPGSRRLKLKLQDGTKLAKFAIVFLNFPCKKPEQFPASSKYLLSSKESEKFRLNIYYFMSKCMQYFFSTVFKIVPDLGFLIRVKKSHAFLSRCSFFS